jgi:hypothetical protein
MHSVDHYFQDISSKHRKKVTIHPNGDFKNGKGYCCAILVLALSHLRITVLWVEPEWDFHDLLCAASVRLGTASVSRAFNGDGKDIRSVVAQPLHVLSYLDQERKSTIV